ncbi:MAG: hypothetical protein QOH24_1017 [Verrucomicrobiota bacterium]|jgi:hypothetical protein
MKRVSLLLALAVALIGSGCADPLERQTTQEVGSQLQRGVTGQGTVGPEEHFSDDPAAEHGVPQTHP